MQRIHKTDWRAAVLAGCAAMLLMLVGCGGPPQVPHDSRRLIESLRTAISTHRNDWLEANAKLVEQRFAEGKLTEPQHEAFVSIIELARAGNWGDAENQAVRLGKAQHGS